jgi:hypothetical protein
MRKIIFLAIMVVLSGSFAAFAQSNTYAAKELKEEKDRFVKQLRSTSRDSAIVNPLARYFESEVYTIYSSVMADGKLPTTDKEKAARSLVYFIQELGKGLKQQKIDMYDVRDALQSYKATLAALLYHKPFAQNLMALGPQRSQLVAASFTQYKEHPLLDDIAVYKRVASAPQFILEFLENQPGFRFSDSLLLDAAAHDPQKLVSYLNRNEKGIQEKIRNTKNIYVRQIVTLSKDRNASELFPFVTEIARNRITPDEILAKRMDAIGYFQLMVNTLMEARQSRDSSSIFLEPLRSGIKQKSLAFFVNQLNELHNAKEAVRFASVKDLRPQDLYYIITSSGDELYTSSYLGLYKRLMEHFKDQSAASLFDLMKYDNFRVFMRLAANYNVLTDFLGKMPQESRQALLHRFIAGIETDKESGLDKAMDIADLFSGIDGATDVSAIVLDELNSNLKRCKAAQEYFGIRLYSILLQVFDLVKQDNSSNRIWATLGNYEMLKRSQLANKNGQITELVLFYGDDDGITSFHNFMKHYTDAKKWKVTKNKSWVSIESVADESFTIYANLPLDAKEGLDLKAQDSLAGYLQQQSLEPTILIHRGHSYHLDKTLQKLTPSVKLAILGSCGGHNKAISIARLSPDVQVIASKKTGAKSINDPVIDAVNDTLLEKKDLSWPDIWSKLSTRFDKDEVTQSLFAEYFPPNKNLSLFVLKLFMFYS